MDKNTEKDFVNIIEKMVTVNEGRQYWFIRTEGGSLYKSFLSDNIVGIGYDKIKYSEISDLSEIEYKVGLKNLTKRVKRAYPDLTRPRMAAAQIYKFCFEVKKGDIVIIPGPYSHFLSFGVVISEATFDRTYNQEIFLSGYKLKDVKWLKTISRDRLNPKLYKLFFTHQAIVNGNDYDEHIDSILNDFFLKNGRLHLKIKIDKESDILARELFEACLGLLKITDDFLSTNGIEEDTSDVEVKISVNSPGEVELIGECLLALCTLGFIIVTLAGGGIGAKILGQNLEFKTEGLLKKLSEFLDNHEKRKLLKKLVHSLDMKEPKDTVKLIENLLDK